MKRTLSIIISGKVQGVYYRQSAREKAIELGLTGHIQNRENGNVEVVATGTAEQLAEFTDWCKKGPPRAVVAGVEILELSFQPFDYFVVLRY